MIPCLRNNRFERRELLVRHRERAEKVLLEQRRAREAQDVVDASVKRAAKAYRRHRTAYKSLVPDGGWEKTMRVLNDSDCRGLGDRLLEQMEEMSEYNAQKFLEGRRGASSSGETSYTLPWIWYSWSEEAGIQITDGMYHGLYTKRAYQSCPQSSWWNGARVAQGRNVGLKKYA